jgi:DNA-binding NarL/FixJ family response regulator
LFLAFNNGPPISDGSSPIRVLVVDDHPLVRDGILAVLQRSPGLEVVGTACLGAASLHMVETLQPDVLLLDVSLPDQSGIELALRVRTSRPDVAVVIVCGSSVRGNSQLLAQLGVRGVVHRSASSDKLVNVIHTAVRGGTLLG